MSEAGWSAAVLQRLRDAAALKGRHRLYDALRSAGFDFRHIHARPAADGKD